jgi:polysaccharide biosynthesis/export protein
VRFRIALISMLCAFSAGCAGKSTIPMGEANLPAATTGGLTVAASTQDYLIGPLDTIGISVFNEPNLSVSEAPVSLSGKVSLPLLGEVPVAGRSSSQVAEEIRSQLNARYLRNAQVSVAVMRAANFTVTVDGEVKKPGIYQIPGARLTLLQAVALGEGVTEFAKLNEVLIIRQIDGKQYAARFDLRAIRATQMADPQVQQSDVIIVGYSSAASLLKTFITALPGAAGIFVALTN